jgi:3-oxoacyl-[acyl-carrier-protein] synthase-3
MAITEQSRILPVGILGLGHYVPPKIVRNVDLESQIDTTDEWIRSRTGIHERRQAEPDVATSDLAFEAAKRALEDAGMEATEIDLIIVATMTPDSMMPATACILQCKLGARSSGALDVSVACSGFAYAMTIGSQFVATGACRRVLVVGADVMSKVMNWKDRSTCVLFGDGAGAVILGPVKPGYGILSTHLGADGRGAPHLKIPAGGSRIPPNSAGVNPEDFYLQMNGPEVYKFAVQTIGSSALTSVQKAGLKPEDVTLFIPHQANIRIINAAGKRLGVPKEKVFVNLENYGNTSCGSIPLALSEARDRGLLKSDDILVLVGFGGGLSWGAITLRWGGNESGLLRTPPAA